MNVFFNRIYIKDSCVTDGKLVYFIIGNRYVIGWEIGLLLDGQWIC